MSSFHYPFQAAELRFLHIPNVRYREITGRARLCERVVVVDRYVFARKGDHLMLGTYELGNRIPTWSSVKLFVQAAVRLKWINDSKYNKYVELVRQHQAGVEKESDMREVRLLCKKHSYSAVVSAALSTKGRKDV